MLDVQHFHVVFTLPAQLRPLAKFAPETLYPLLFRATANTLKAFAKNQLRADIGATLVLHTWTRKLELHPHVHAIVTAGGLCRQERRWRPSSRSFLFPLEAMSRVLRGKMRDALRREYRRGSFASFPRFLGPASLHTPHEHDL